MLALEFSLADGLSVDVEFLKVFFSTTYVDMSVLEKLSPYFAAERNIVRRLSDVGDRGSVSEQDSKPKFVNPPSIDLQWDAWTYVLKKKIRCSSVVLYRRALNHAECRVVAHAMIC